MVRGPLILLSPAKTLNFESKLPAALASVTPAAPSMAGQANELVSACAALSKPQLKSLMSLSDSLAALNHGRFADFDAQPERVAIGAFEGAAYKGMDARSLDADDLGYLQSSLRILCGLYGVLRPYDAIRPYRLEMSTKLAVGSHANLYAYWGDALTESLNAEIDATAAPFVLNVASQEYAKSVKLAALRAPVVTANFPGPAVHAKEARGAITRYCAEQRVTRPDELRGFTGRAGEWAYVEAESTETKLVFHRGAAPAKKAAAAKKGRAEGASPARGRKAAKK
jgi:cytoplasmic iron level regulating protein YaaA (DUF328/UPF0246 family)